MWIIVAALVAVARPALAIDSSDLANNAVSDLGPLIALFGEQTTTHFMRSSFSPLDYILFAMAPIGILTAINAAIRVSNITSLKVLVGRAGESEENVEIELLSSTSRDVCEIWNGRELIKATGNGKVIEVLSLKKQKPDTNGVDEGIERRLICYNEQDVMKMEPVRRTKSSDPESSQASIKKSGSSTTEAKPAIQTPNTAPNISLNFRDPECYSTATQRGKPMIHLSLAAACGVFLQSGVLAYFLVLTLHPALRDDSGDPLPTIGLGLAFSGTVLLVLGMLLCVLVVEKSTEEEQWKLDTDRIKEFEDTFGLMWIQTCGQLASEYGSYIIFADGPHKTIVTSHRRDETKKWHRDLIVVIAACSTMCGFILQLFGLRMMHWSASVAQFGTTLVMIVIRAAVRYHMADPPRAHRIPDTHELDWVATRLERTPKEKHSLFKCAKKKDWHGCELWDDGCRHWSVDWSVDVHRQGDDPTSATDDGLLPEGSAPPQGEAQFVLKARERLGALRSRMDSSWTGPEVEIAAALSHAIEHIMNSICRGNQHSQKRYYWKVPVSTSSPKDHVYFRLDWDDGKWKSQPKEIEAFISLWLFQLRSKKRASTGEIRKAMRCVEPWKPKLHHNLLLWGRNMLDMSLYITKEAVGEKTASLAWDSETLTSHMAVGFSPCGSDTRTFWTRSLRAAENEDYSKCYLAISFDASLRTLCAHELFCRFLQAALSIPEFTKMEGDTTVQNGGSQDSWETLSLQNVGLVDLAQKIKETGLLSFEHAYLYLVIVLSKLGKLPYSQTVLETVTKKASRLTAKFHFDEAADLYAWLLPAAKEWSDEMAEGARLSAIGFLRQMEGIIRTLESELAPAEDVMEARRARDKVSKTLGGDSSKDVYLLYPPFDSQGPASGLLSIRDPKILAKIPKWAEDEDQFLKQAKDFVDNFGRTALHYFTISENPSVWCEVEGSKNKLLAFKVLLSNRAEGNIRGSTFNDPNSIDMFGRTPLHEAASRGLEEMVDFLIRKGADVEIQDSKGMTALQCATLSGHLRVAELLLREGADLNAQDHYRKSAQHWFCHGFKEMAAVSDDCLAFFGTFASGKKLRDRHGRTPLHLAAVLACDRKLYLAMKGLEKPVRDIQGMYPLHLAAWVGHPQFAWLFGMEQHSIREATDNEGRALLHLAAIGGHMSVIEVLLFQTDGKTRDINVVTSSGKTALHLAVEDGQEKVVSGFLGLALPDDELLAFLFAVDHSGYTALHVAANVGHRAIVEVLMEGMGKDAPNLQARTGMNDTPLHISVSKGHMKIVELLLEKGAKVSATNKEKMTPIHVAAMKGRTEIMELLREHGASIEERDKDGQTPLIYAAREGQKDALLSLIAWGASIDEKDSSGRTALHLAALNGEATTVELLLDKRAEVDVTDSGGWTALFFAAKSGQDTIAELLLEWGADVSAKSITLQTALHLAVASGSVDTVKLLLKKGADVNAKGRLKKLPISLVQKDNRETDRAIREVLEEYMAKSGSKE